MLEESTPISAIKLFQREIASGHSLQALQDSTQAFGQKHLAVETAVLARSGSPPSSSNVFQHPIDKTGYVLRLQRARPFDDNEKEMTAVMASLLGSAPYFMSLAQPSPDQLQLLRQMGQAIANKRQFKAITAVLEKGFSTALPQATGKLLLWQQPSHQLTVHSVLGQPGQTGNLEPVTIAGPVAEALQLKETVIVSDHSSPQIIIPATVKDEVVALLHVFYPETEPATPFPAGDLVFLELLVGYVSIAFNNTRLLAQAWQRANQLETIYRVTESALALQPLETTLTQIQERLMSAFSASLYYVALYDANNQTLSFPWVIRREERITLAPVSISNPNSLAAWVVTNNRPFITGDSQSEPTPAKDMGIGPDIPRSIICVPLRDGSDVLGAISIQHDSSNAFDSAEFKTFIAVAAHIAVIIKNARLYDQTQVLVHQGTRDYQTAVILRQAIAFISSSLEPDGVLNQLLLALGDVFTYDTASVYLYNGKLRHAVSRDYQKRPLAASIQEMEQAWTDSNLLQEIFSGQEALIMPDVTADPRWPVIPGAESVRSWIGAPLILQKNVLGVLMVQSYRPKAFGEHEKWLAMTLSTHTAVSLNNARLYQRTQEQLAEISTLYQASATMTANLDQDFVLQTVVSEMVRAIKVDSCTIFVWDEHRQSFNPAAHKSILYDEDGEKAIGLRSIENLENYPTVKRLFQTQEIYSLRRDKAVTPDDLALLKVAKLQSILLVPLVRSAKMLGVLALGQLAQPRAFRRSELWLAQNLAGQAAVAIEHAHLFGQARRRIDELSTFHSIVLQLNTPLQLSSVLDTITESALRLVDASNLHIYLYNAETDEYTFGSALWRDGRRKAAVVAVRSGGLTATVVQNGKPLVINDASKHALFQSEEAQAWGICAIAGFPLKYSAQVIGAFTITYLKPHTFSDDELLLLNLLADQAAVAVKNARLFDESERRLRDMSALVDMAKQVTGDLKLKSVLQTTVQILQKLLNARASTITMLADNSQELLVVAAVGVSPDIIDKARMNIGEGISGEAVNKRELVYIRDTHEEPDFLFFSEVVRSLLVVPLIVRDEAIGTLTVDSDKPNAFDQSDIQLMTIAAAQVGVAIANAGLFEEVEERAVELAVAYEELKESDRLKDELVQNVSHELRTPLTFVKGYVDLLTEGEMGPLSPEQTDALDIVSTKTDEITRLIEDIITLQRIDSGNLQLEPISMSDYLKTAVASHQIVASQKGLNIAYKKPAIAAMVYMDKGRINQVVDNLIGNAMKFSPDGGTITITITERTADVLVSIIDEGIGVPHEKQQKIFERFYQVDGSSRRRFGGTGIGLAIVKRIVDAHQGQIWVESEVGQGSAFYFSLPRVLAPETVEPLPDHNP